MRWDIINSVIKSLDADSYLEIGLAYGDTFKRVNANVKVGVDPDLRNFKSKVPQTDCKIYEMTSDLFFEQYKGDTFDVIFIDGLHDAEQVQKDIENSLKILGGIGAIILHDTMPPDARYVTDKPTLKSKSGNWLWCGDVWKIFSWLCTKDDLNYWTINEDYGCTIIVRGKNESARINPPNWFYFNSNRLSVGKVVTLSALSDKLNSVEL